MESIDAPIMNDDLKKELEKKGEMHTSEIVILKLNTLAKNEYLFTKGILMQLDLHPMNFF